MRVECGSVTVALRVTPFVDLDSADSASAAMVWLEGEPGASKGCPRLPGAPNRGAPGRPYRK